MKNAEKLIKDVEKKVRNWDERNSFTLKGVKNLSLSDMDTLVLYAEQYIRVGSFRGLMEPMGDINKILKAYGLTESERYFHEL